MSDIAHLPSPARHWLGCVSYAPTVANMQARVAELGPQDPDEFWMLEHQPVYTLGLAAAPEHILKDTQIPVVQADRGGEVTYHGPGQLVVYPLIHLQRRDLRVRRLVWCIEEALIRSLAHWGVTAARRLAGAPGVYVPWSSGAVGVAKVASLGLRLKKGWSTHGLALNVGMDLGPFADINPCGMSGMPVTDLATLGVSVSVHEAGQTVCDALEELLQA